ncbi:hypothetical protein E8E11_000016 [Didymella keratinophila]|nr:hypothetical protein E8E11_000016 [Didymella keratinophila]
MEELTPEPPETQPPTTAEELSTSRTLGAQDSTSAAAQTSVSSNASNEPRTDPQLTATHPEGPLQHTVGRNDPEEDALDRELQELEAWHERAAKMQKVARLREAQARHLAGDPNALQMARVDTVGTHSLPVVPTSGLPRPEPPHMFSKRTRADYNCWKRDCERYFERLPANFPQEVQKVDFGVQYLSETMKSLWAAYCTDQRLIYPLWVPTWAAMKAVMLGALGTLSERRQKAYEALNRARMLPHSTPTELLDYMRPYWEELDTTHGPELQVMGFIHALPDDIQKQLFMYPEDRRATLTQVEEIANLIHRQRGRLRASQDNGSAKHQGKSIKAPKGGGGSKETPKRAQEGGSTHNGPKRPRGTQSKSGSPAITCYGCGESGHIHPNCPNSDRSKKPTNEQDLGKGKGQKG